MARVRSREAETFVYKVTATLPDGSTPSTSRFSRRAARNVAEGYLKGRDPIVEDCGEVLDEGRPPALFVQIHVGVVAWGAEAKPYPGEF